MPVLQEGTACVTCQDEREQRADAACQPYKYLGVTKLAASPSTVGPWGNYHGGGGEPKVPSGLRTGQSQVRPKSSVPSIGGLAPSSASE